MLSCLAPGRRAKVHKTRRRSGYLPYFYGGRWAILDPIHKGEWADLPVQALTKVACH